MKKFSALLCLLLFFPALSRAEITPHADNLNWLRKIAVAPHQLNYSGVFVYQSGNRVETSRITHLSDEAGEHEKLEALDGARREVIRNNDQVYCYYPDKNTVVIEKRRAIKPFPSLLPRQLSDLTENYRIRKGATERVAGFESQVIVLEPKDAFRYTRVLWADAATGLLLKTNARNEKNEVIEQFYFTQLAIGGKIDKNLFVPKRLASKAPEDPFVTQDESGLAVPETSGWEVTQLPPGFKKIKELKRTMPGKKHPVQHLVYSDGLAAVSIFIEPREGDAVEEGLMSQGAINVFSKALPGYKVIVLGEVPAATVTQIANSVVYRGK